MRQAHGFSIHLSSSCRSLPSFGITKSRFLWLRLFLPLCLCVLSWSSVSVAQLSFGQGDIVAEIRGQVAQGSFSAAKSELDAYKAQHGVTPEYLEALSWMARGAESARQWDQASAYAAETRSLVEKQLAACKCKLDSDPHLPTALGAAYEVLAQTMAEKGQH